MVADRVRAGLEAIIGVSHVFPAPDGPRLNIRPGSTEEVSRCLQFLNAQAVPVVPLGGLTGLVGGTDLFGAVVGLSTERLNRIKTLDPLRNLLTVEAGVKLEQIHAYASENGFRYGVDFGARGSCSIGGNIATNAGGNAVLRFGMTRANVAGLEVVLADGRVLSDTGGLAKNNTGYDLKQLFIGSEGTLGIITQAVLKLSRPSADTASVLLAISSLDHALGIMGALEKGCGQALLSLEIMWNRYFRTVSRAIAKGAARPISDIHPFYILAQAEGDGDRVRAQDILLEALEDVDGIVDSALADTRAGQNAFWAIRDGSEVIENSHPRVLSFDVSMRPQDYATYVGKVEERLARDVPHAVPYNFGHLSDGNVHFMIGHDGTVAEADHRIEDCVYETLSDYWPTSVSAEHGIGREKAGQLWRSRSAEEIAVMHALRVTLDPAGTLNPHVQYRAGPAASGSGVTATDA
ncbi:FAD/FMN-dependent dehydrogenase [Rhizobium leguminosarum bv. trifolii WSM597]|uniref:FAD/FMN-dependent dehydrogenase n=1 Tax=Rhizobium leguminosarum bv. trifolii WSM597 TaxID=754764 RepID=J0H9I8_RHILT|nr:FAD-binding oxidoreductase [Rhizobium leguminosarum]EJB07018.1 FAD/FMN-dependent dehydrogenase [Rhizobium leguminosarum bv. trifolii WSM597]